MAVDIHRIFRQGDRPRLEFLEYCVRSVQMDPVFVFLVREYQNGPTAAKALALYDVFCGENAPARLTVTVALPPLNLRLLEAMRALRESLNPGPAPSGAGERHPAGPVGRKPPTVPPARGRGTQALLTPKYLFDAVTEAVEGHSVGWKRIKRRYRPRRKPLENLPGGKMTVGQRHFVEKIWGPVIRPRLVAAGFWRVATVA